MCVVSMVMDHFHDKWAPRVPTWPTIPSPQPVPLPYVPAPPAVPFPGITPEEIQELRDLLERAREYDRRNSEPDCELDSKKDALKKLAKALGVEIDFL
jgi:hypothetical protein